MRSLKERPPSFWATALLVVGGFSAMATAIIQWDAIKPWPSEQACDALLWTLQRDIFAAQRNETEAVELASRLTDPDARALNRQVLRSARESLLIFQDQKAHEMKECNR
jgi:hypothetical protein